MSTTRLGKHDAGNAREVCKIPPRRTSSVSAVHRHFASSLFDSTARLQKHATQQNARMLCLHQRLS